MGVKLPKDTYPSGLGPNDFECSGPVATEDGDFYNTRLADLGCFKQDGTDTNKAYHGAVAKGSNGKWYAYFEWGRTGKKGAFQFMECYSESDAVDEYVKQMESKNSKRGEWVTLAGKRVLQAKPGKDCYLVRPLATRSSDSFGLPSATSVVTGDVKVKTTTKKRPAGKKASAVKLDPKTVDLMRALNVATVNYTKKSMQGGTIPTQASIDRGRDLLVEAMKIVSKIGDDEKVQINDTTLKMITQEYYARIPIIKPVGAPVSTWILGTNNILRLQTNLDAYESALKTTMCIEEEEVSGGDPLGGIPIDLSWIDPKSEAGQWIYKWMPKASKNVHGHRPMKIRNAWLLERHGTPAKFNKAVDQIIAANRGNITERPLFQPTKPAGLDSDAVARYKKANVGFLFHGTKSVNVSGIMREGLRLPNQLVGVAITGALLGPGVYWADDWGKSANYCSGGNSYWAKGQGHIKSRGSFMFVAEVALGNPHIAAKSHGYTKPPAGFDSVFGKSGYTSLGYGSLQNNEWIVYSTDSSRLRYLVEFDY